MMRDVRLNHSIRQLGLAAAGFVAVLLLLDSGGLASWANRLEMGPLRLVAVPAVDALQRVLKPLGVEAARTRALEGLALLGWSDDAALVAKETKTGSSGAPATGGCATGATPASLGAVAHPTTGATSGARTPGAAGADAPLVSNVPRMTELTPLPPVEAGRPRVVALAGDSMMAVGLSATLMRQTATNKNLRMVKVFRSGTGLARPEVFNWQEEYPAMLGAERPDVVIVAIGANDGQGFVVDGKVLAYGSEGWRKVYQERLAAYLAMVGAGGARVIWVGLPPMRVPTYDEKIAEINRIAYTVVSQAPGATWWNPVSFVGDDAGRFREFVTLGNGKTMRIRSADGIHLSDEGAGLLTGVLVKWLDPPVEKPSLPVAAAGAPPVEPQATVRPKRRARRAAKG